MTDTTPHPTEQTAAKPSKLVKYLRWRYMLPLLVIVSPLAFLGGYRAYYLSMIPLIDHPFDVKAFGTVEIDPAENAFPLYDKAVAKLSFSTEPDANDLDKVLNGTWEAASKNVRQWLVDNQEALQVYRQAVELPEYLAHQPKNITFDTLLPVAQQFRTFARLAVVQGKKLEAAGDVDAAWDWYEAAFRSSRHIGQHGTLVERLVGNACHAITTDAIVGWANHPAVTGLELRQAGNDLNSEYAKTAATSVAIKVECLAQERLLRDEEMLQEYFDFGISPKGYLHTWSRVEPELSIRLTRHTFTNMLSEADKPKHRRAATVGPDNMLFDLPVSSTSSTGVSTAKLSDCFKRSLFARMTLPAIPYVLDAIDKEQARQNILLVILAAQQYRREHGEFPPDANAIIAGGYLDEMPLDALQSTKIPVSYSNRDGRVAVYSLGNDGIDDGDVDLDPKTGDYGYVLTPKTKKGED